MIMMMTTRETFFWIVYSFLLCLLIAVGVLEFTQTNPTQAAEKDLPRVNQLVVVEDFEPETTFVVVGEETLSHLGIHFILVQRDNEKLAVFKPQLPSGMTVEKGQQVRLVMLTFWQSDGLLSRELVIKQ